MSSDRHRAMYTEFEPDANEILFGQRTAPNRPLTEKEVATKKKLILKFVDQRLKFELVELMGRQQQPTFTSFIPSNLYDFPTDCNQHTSNVYNCVSSSGFHDFNHEHGHEQNESVWQPNYPVVQQHEDPVHTMWPTADYNFQPNFQLSEQHRNTTMTPFLHPNRNQRHPNLILVSTESSKDTKPKCSSTRRSTNRTSTANSIPPKTLTESSKNTTEPKCTSTVNTSNITPKTSVGKLSTTRPLHSVRKFMFVSKSDVFVQTIFKVLRNVL